MSGVLTIPDAIFSWWVEPLAVADGPYTWVGAIDSAGVNHLYRVDATTVQDAILGSGEVDDHNATAVALAPHRPDLWAFYAEHDETSVVRYRTVNRVTMATGVEQALDFGAADGTVTYAQPLVYGDRVVLLTRQDATRWRYRTSEDWGATWGPARTLLDTAATGQSYLTHHIDPCDPATVHLAAYGHPVNSTWRDVGYCRLNLATGAVTSMAGAALGDLDAAGGPQLLPGDLDTAVAPSTTFRVRIFGIGLLGGRPAIPFAVWNTDQGDGALARYRMKLWTGSTWVTNVWDVEAGPVFGYLPAVKYVGGVALGRDGTVWTARNDTTAGEWTVERWRWNGSTFILAGEVDRSATRLIRPRAVVGAGMAELVYQRVPVYNGFGDWDSDLEVV